MRDEMTGWTSRWFHFAVLIVLAVEAQAAVISVNFDNGGPSMDTADLAGAPGVRVDHWNNWGKNDLTLGDAGQTIRDDSGTAVPGFTASINSVGWASRNNNTVNDTALYSDIIDVQSSTRTISVSGIPYAVYDVYAYMRDDDSDRAGAFTIDTTTYYMRGFGPGEGAGDPASDGTGYVQSSDTTYGTGADIDQGNYVVFTGREGAGFDLDLVAVNASDGTMRNKVAGFQIVQAAVDTNQPAGLSAAAGVSQIELSWESIASATNYNVKRSLTSDGSYVVLDTVTATTYTDTAVTNGVLYYYVVSSNTGEGESSNSDEVFGIPSLFVHPGGVFKRSDLDRMRYQVEQQILPWYASFNELQTEPKASYNYSVQGNSYTTVARGGVNGGAFESDANAAYLNALMWAITQNVRHADKCVEIFNEWKTLTNVQGGGTEALNAGLFAWKLVEAAEIIRSTYPGWEPSDVQEFQDMLVYPGYSDTAVPGSVNTSNGTFYWRIYQGDPGRHGNQDMIAWRAMIIMGVFLDNEKMYDRALNYFKGEPGRMDDIPMPDGPSPSGSVADDNIYFTRFNHLGSTGAIADYGYNGVLTNYFWENGQCQESSRDQEHTLFGLGIAAGIAEVAWSQGDSVWNGFDGRLLKAFEFQSKYNTSFMVPSNTFPDQPTPWEPGTNFIPRKDRTGRWFSKLSNPHFEGDFVSISRGPDPSSKRPVYEQGAMHFGVRMGMSTNDYLWTLRGREAGIDQSGYETTGFSLDHAGWGAITFRRPVLAAGDPIKAIAAGDIPQFGVHSLPGMIEAENYDHFPDDGEGHTYHDLTATNSGGFYRDDAVDIASDGAGGGYLTDLESGEWVAYTVSIPSNGVYDISVRYAGGTGDGTIRFSIGGADVTTNIALSATGGGINFVTHEVAGNVALNAGVQVLRMHIGGASGSFNVDSIKLSGASPAGPPSGLGATPGDGQVSLLWNAVPNAVSYHVKRSATDSPYMGIQTTSNANWIDAGVVNGTLYHYVISANGSGGESDDSEVASARPVSLTSPQLDFNLSASTLLLSWPASHTGWRLETQTNALSKGISTNWVQVNGVQATNSWSMAVNQTNPSVFLRLVYP